MRIAKPKVGYKQTEVGVIPADWEVRPFGQFAQFRNGLNFIKSARGDKVKVVGVGDFQSRFRVSQDGLDHVQISGSLSPDDLLQHNDLLFVRSNGNKSLIGRCVLIQGFDQQVSFSGFTIRGRVSYSLASPEYLARYFQSIGARRQIKEAGEGSHISNLSQQVLASLKIPLPTLAEQEAIASALSDADGLIESLETLIAKKRQIKHGTMQELLTGKRRLPGFTGKWETKRLGEIADIRGGGTPSTIEEKYWDGSISWCTPSDITALSGYKYLTTTSRCITHAGLTASSAEIVPINSVIMTSRATIGECAITKIPLTTNQGFKNFIPYELTHFEFLYYILSNLKRSLIGLCAGSTFLEIGKAQLRQLTILFPSYLEQCAIASTLSEMDLEIALLGQSLAKARQVKQGMMQELLTGRTRLI